MPQIVVPNARIALGKLAQAVKAAVARYRHCVRRQNTVRTWSTFLSERGSVLATRRWGNDIGVPLTLLRLDRHQFAVVGVGRRMAKFLTDLVQPMWLPSPMPFPILGALSLLGVARARAE